MVWKTVAGALVAISLAASPALACKGPNVLLEDNFSEADPSWAVYDKAVIEDGALKITADAGYLNWIWYDGSTFDNADVCVDVTIPELKNAQTPVGGLIFLGADNANYYMAWMSPLGTVGVQRRVNSKWVNPVPARKAEMKNKMGDSNTLRVTFEGTKATLYVNDKKVVDFKVQPPQGGGARIGFIGESEAERANTWAFTNLKVTDVAK